MPDSSIALYVKFEIASIWARLAISGTTPPYSLCVSICEAVKLDKICLSVSVIFTTAADVSSQDDSMDKISILFKFAFI